MGEWVDFAEIRRRVSLEDVMYRFYALEGLTRKGNKVAGPCPVHGGDSPRAFNADLDKNVWFCFSKCKSGGNQIDFVARKERSSVRDAALQLKAFFLNGSEPAMQPAPSPSRANGNGHRHPRSGDEGHSNALAAEIGNPPIDVKLHLAADHPHLLSDRGLHPATIEHFGVGYCSRGIMRGTIAIPIHDEQGQLVAYAGRRLKPQAIRENGKYVLPKKFRKQLVLYNFHRAVPHAADEGLILVEGFFSVMSLHQMGLGNVVASMGCDLSDAQANLLAQASEVVVLFDGNEAGRLGAKEVQRRLEGRARVRVVTLPHGLEPEDLSPEQLRWVFEGLRTLDFSEISLEQGLDISLLVPPDHERVGIAEVSPPIGSARCAHE